MLREDVMRGLAVVGAAGLVYDLLVAPAKVAAAVKVAERLPELEPVPDHAAKPPIAAAQWQPWADGITALGERENAYRELSGLVTEADWAQWQVGHLRRSADHVFGSFGARRVMSGSDWPVCELAAAYEVILDAAVALTGSLTDPERLEVFEHTAKRVCALS